MCNTATATPQHHCGMSILTVASNRLGLVFLTSSQGPAGSVRGLGAHPSAKLPYVAAVGLDRHVRCLSHAPPPYARDG